MKFLMLLFSVPTLFAGTTYVTVDTSSLAGDPFSIFFYLIDGDATLNNVVQISNAQFGGGSLFGSPTLDGDVSGSLATTVTIGDMQFFNAYSHIFFTGSFLSFDLSFTSNFAGGTPDSLAFLLLDNNTGLPIPTLDPLGSDVFLLFDLSNPGLGQAYATDPQRTSIVIPAPSVTAATNEVPEPATLFMVSTTLIAILAINRRRRLK